MPLRPRPTNTDQSADRSADHRNPSGRAFADSSADSVVGAVAGASGPRPAFPPGSGLQPELRPGGGSLRLGATMSSGSAAAPSVTKTVIEVPSFAPGPGGPGPDPNFASAPGLSPKHLRRLARLAPKLTPEAAEVFGRPNRLPHEVEDRPAAPWRPAYELRSLAGWTAGGVTLLSMTLHDMAPVLWTGLPMGMCLIGAVTSFSSAWARFSERSALSGAAPLFMSLEDVAAVMKRMRRPKGLKTSKTSKASKAPKPPEARKDPSTPAASSTSTHASRDTSTRAFSSRIARGGARVLMAEKEGAEVESIWFGVGYAWKPIHAQRLHELTRFDWAPLVVPTIFRRLFTADPGLPDTAAGLPLIHGVGLSEGERPIVRPLTSLGGGTLIVGTTQCGKGVMLTNLITQAIMRGDVVIVMDPKSSSRLRDAIFAATAAAGRGEPLEFHPAFPDRGIRLDPLGSFSRPTELASRVAAVMPSDTSGAFTSFAWSAVNVAVMGMLYVEERPTLLKLAMVIESGVDDLLGRAIVKHLEEVAPNWRDRLPPLDPTMKGPAPDTDPELLRLVRFWEREVGPSHPEAVIRELLQTFKHNREHYGKITASLQPILTMLTAGSLGKTLSPDRDDPEDHRPIMTLERIVRDGGVLYLGLDALPDATVASALGSILLADLTALAGKRYNTGETGEPIALFVDETANVINQPMIELLNKGLEAGVNVTAAMQTVADLAARLGDRDRAAMALGNLNNLIVLRTKDQVTQNFVAEAFGKTLVTDQEASISTSSGGVLPGFRASASRRISHDEADLVPVELLGKLPNLEFFASLSGGKLYKGRVPILKLGPHPEGILWRELAKRRSRLSRRGNPAAAVLGLLGDLGDLGEKAARFALWWRGR